MPICNSNGVNETGACPVNIDSRLLYANAIFHNLSISSFYLIFTCGVAFKFI